MSMHDDKSRRRRANWEKTSPSPSNSPARTAVVNLGRGRTSGARSLDERPRKIQLGLTARETVLAEISLPFSDIGSATRNSVYHGLQWSTRWSVRSFGLLFQTAIAGPLFLLTT